MKRLAALAASSALLAPAAAAAAPASTVGDPVFVDAAPTSVATCASPDQSDWSFTHQTAPFAAPYAGGIMRLTFNQPMAYPESHPDIYTDVPLGLPDFTIPAGSVLWSFAAASDAANRVSVPFVCPGEGIGALDVRMEFFPTPTAPVTYGGRGARTQWSLLVFRVDEPSVVSMQANGPALAYRFEDANSPTLLANPGQVVQLGAVNAGEHGVFVAPQVDVASDWSVAVTAAGGSSGPAAPDGYGTTNQPPPPAVAKPAAKRRPAVRKRPRVTGVARVGRIVRCNRGTFARAQRYQIRWRRGAKLIPRRVSATYRLTKVDGGRLISCQVKAINAAGAVTVRSKAVKVRGKAATVRRAR